MKHYLELTSCLLVIVNLFVPAAHAENALTLQQA